MVWLIPEKTLVFGVFSSPLICNCLRWLEKNRKIFLPNGGEKLVMNPMGSNP